MIPIFDAYNEIGNLISVYCLDSTAITDFSKTIFSITPETLIGDKSKDYIASIVSIPYVPGVIEKQDVTFLEYGKTSKANVFTSPHLAGRMKRRYVRIGDFYSNLSAMPTPSYMSFPPYSQWSVYLPYYGFLPLDPNFFIFGTTKNGINIQYDVDVVSGDCLISIYSMPNAVSGKLVSQVSCNVGKRIELASVDNSGFVRSVGQSLIGFGTAAITGNPAALVGAGVSVGVSALTPAVSVQTVGQMSSDTAIMTDKSVYLRVTTATTISEGSYKNEKGLPSAKHLQVSTLAGYAEFAEIHLDGITASEGEINEIDTILKSGFIA